MTIPLRRVDLQRCAVAIFAALCIGCGDSHSNPGRAATTKSADKPSLIVTSRPLFEMAGTIAGDAITVTLATPDDTSSRHWEPGADDVGRLRTADLLLLSGAGYEPWKDRVSLPLSRTKDSAAGYYDQFIRIPDAITHQHGPEGSHSHPGTVWATWLDPELAAAQLQHVAKEVARLSPQHADRIGEAAARAAAPLAALSDRISRLREATAASPPAVLADAPYYQYLTRKLGWELRYVHWTAAAIERAPEELTELQNLLSALPPSGMRLFFAHREHPEAVRALLEQSGVCVVRIDLCEAADENKSLTERLATNVESIEAAVDANAGR